jgi:hypothetical protein
VTEENHENLNPYTKYLDQNSSLGLLEYEAGLLVGRMVKKKASTVSLFPFQFHLSLGAWYFSPHYVMVMSLPERWDSSVRSDW